MPVIWQLFLIFAPAACAGAGLLTGWIAHRGACERLQDRAYDQGWLDGREKAEAFSGTMVPDIPATVVLHRVGPSHARAQPTADAARADAAVLLTRARFAAIRSRFDLGELGAPAVPSEVDLDRWAAVIGPTPGGPLQAAGAALGPAWPGGPGPV